MDGRGGGGANLPGEQEELRVGSCDQELGQLWDKLEVGELQLGCLLPLTHCNAGLTRPSPSCPHLHRPSTVHQVAEHQAGIDHL